MAGLGSGEKRFRVGDETSAWWENHVPLEARDWAGPGYESRFEAVPDRGCSKMLRMRLKRLPVLPPSLAMLCRWSVGGLGSRLRSGDSRPCQGAMMLGGVLLSTSPPRVSCSACS